MSRAPSIENLGIDSVSVVTNPHGQTIVGVFQFEIDALRSGMTKGVDERFSPEPVNLLLDRRSQRLLVADDSDVKVDTRLRGEFLTNRRKSRDQIQRAGARRSKSLNGFPAFLYPLPHELKNRVKLGFDLRVGHRLDDSKP